MRVNHLEHSDCGIRCTGCGVQFEVSRRVLMNPARLLEWKESIAAAHQCRKPSEISQRPRVWRSPTGEQLAAYFAKEVRRYMKNLMAAIAPPQPASPDNVAAQQKGAPEVETLKLKDLVPDRRNANRGTERGQQMIENSLRQYGAGRSILIDKNGRILAGNKTAETAGAIGLEDVIVIKTDGTKLVAVQRTDLDLETDQAAKELGIADNRAGQVSLNWDLDVLKELSGGDDAVALEKFFTAQELEFMFDVPDEGGNKKKKGLDQSDDLRYQIVIDCDTESQQTSMLDRVEGEGIKCRPLIS